MESLTALPITPPDQLPQGGPERNRPRFKYYTHTSAELVAAFGGIGLEYAARHEKGKLELRGHFRGAEYWFEIFRVTESSVWVLCGAELERALGDIEWGFNELPPECLALDWPKGHNSRRVKPSPLWVDSY